MKAEDARKMLLESQEAYFAETRSLYAGALDTIYADIKDAVKKAANKYLPKRHALGGANPSSGFTGTRWLHAHPPEARRKNHDPNLLVNTYYPMTKTFIAGHKGMVGSALMRHAHAHGIPTLTATRDELNLLNQKAVFKFLRDNQPEQVIIAAAKVGGIHANATYPADFLYENLMIATNLIEGSYRAGIKRLLFLGSSCIYPRDAQQPIPESALLTSSLETTNEAYAIAKIAGLKLCQHYRAQYGVAYHSVMPCNLYGPNDNYHPENSHVIPALIRRFHEAKIRGDTSVEIWGTGKPLREFLHVDDLARACFMLLGLENPPDWVNVGYGWDYPIWETAQRVAAVVGYRGLIIPDPSKPDGTHRKLLNTELITSLGWRPEIALHEGLTATYQDFLTTYKP